MFRTMLPLLCFAVAASAQPAGLPLMPWPASIVHRGLPLSLERGLHVQAPTPRLTEAGERFRERLAKRTGVHHSAADAPLLTITIAAKGGAIPHLGDDESYRLKVDASGVKLDAKTEWGALRGLETALQLANPSRDGMAMAPVLIEDRPRFPWRGLLLDVARHFMSVADVKRTLDGMAAAKLNVLHWHLSDDQGFRVESRAYPKLHTVGGEGKFYTHAEVRDVVAYAAERGIRVVPEFDIPGHATAWAAAYPEIASGKGPYTVERKWGIFDPTLDPTRDEVYTFLDRLFGEIAPLFPDPYFHIGGDEVSGREWRLNERIQRYISEKKLNDNHGLQAHFNTRLVPILKKHGKIVVGWDEVFHPDLPKEVVVQSWRGPASLLEAARAGHRGILSFGYYLDLNYPAAAHYLIDPLAMDAQAYRETAEFFGLAEGPRALPVKAVTEFASKMGGGIEPAVRNRVLGGEACLWAEFITPENLDLRLWPRLAAVAERYWSPAETKDVRSMYERLDAFALHLAGVGIDPAAVGRRMRMRIAGGRNLPALETLASVVEPAKEYFRSGTEKYTSHTPLNRLVDSIPPESAEARRFGELVRRYLKTGEGRIEIEQRLVEWAGVLELLQRDFDNSPLLSELRPVAAELRALAADGFAALKGQPLKARPYQPVSELMIAIAPHVRMLSRAGK